MYCELILAHRPNDLMIDWETDESTRINSLDDDLKIKFTFRCNCLIALTGSSALGCIWSAHFWTSSMDCSLRHIRRADGRAAVAKCAIQHAKLRTAVMRANFRTQLPLDYHQMPAKFAEYDRFSGVFCKIVRIIKPQRQNCVNQSWSPLKTNVELFFDKSVSNK